MICHQIAGLELTVSEENGWPIPLVSNESSAAKIRSLLEEVCCAAGKFISEVS